MDNTLHIHTQSVISAKPPCNICNIYPYLPPATANAPDYVHVGLWVQSIGQGRSSIYIHVMVQITIWYNWQLYQYRSQLGFVHYSHY